MGKIAPVSAKYIIYAKLNANGIVEKPDVIGAIFGQTEGLLGDELELRELQKSGRIGRIDVDLKVAKGKTEGEISIPSSMDKAETAIIAAALETIQRVGPCDATIKVEKIEDVRVTKREYVVERAKEILKRLIKENIPDSSELTEHVSKSVRMLEITEYGPEKIPAGPAVNESDEVILVEGRADVIALLKNNIKNAIAVGGTNIPESIIKLTHEKETTVFVDGDRGGDLIIEELKRRGADIDFIARAPYGKEVEELTKKQIHQALRAKIPVPQEHKNVSRHQSTTNHKVKINEEFVKLLNELEGSKGAYLLDENLNILAKIPAKEIPSVLREIDNINTIVMDGIVDKRLYNSAKQKGIERIVCKGSEIQSKKIEIVTL